MNPVFTDTLAQTRIADLHRQAADRRLARQVTSANGAHGTGIGTSLSADIAATWAALTTRLNTRRHRAVDTICCPA